MQPECLKEKYSRYICSPEKNAEAIIEILKSKVDCIEQPIDMEGSSFVNMMKENVIHCIWNRNHYLQNNLVFKYYHVKENEKSVAYYSNLGSEFNEIIVVIEMCTGYIYCNCYELFLELVIKRGINKEDIESNNDLCKAYLSQIQHFLKEDE